MSKLLIDEPPLQVLPSLAKIIGLNEAIITQQIHYWVNGKQGKTHEGERWIYNSYRKWQAQFPFWSIPTIQRAFASAESQGILVSRQEGSFNREKWYRIDYIKLESCIISKRYDGTYQNDMVSSYQNDMVLTEIETTTETTSRGNKRPAEKELLDYFCELTGLVPNGDKKHLGKRWYQPIRRMTLATDGDGKDILREAVTKMRRDGMVIAAPQSVENVFNSIQASRTLKGKVVKSGDGGMYV